MPYGETWRRQRSAFQRDMTPQKATSYVPLINASCKVLMHALLRSPEQFEENFYKYSGGIMLKICYGLSDERECDNVVKDLTKIWEASLAAAVPGTNLVDLVPSLDYLPDFLSPWRKDAVRVRDETRRIFTDLVQHVREKNKEKLRLDDLDLAFLTASVFEAGTDTTTATLSTFIMAAASYPSALVAAQAEIDRVCGDRPPTIDDVESLPFVKAMVKETMRWRPVVAGGVPHQATTTEDDYYNGMRIPAGALVIVNQYGMAMNQTMYGQKYNAEIFEPRRWTDRPEGVGDMFEANQGFGFGRRICPGRHLAVKTLFIAVANLCYWFDIRPRKGYSIDVHKFTSALVVHPEPFKCYIMPRTGRAAHIEKEAEAASELLSNL
ncbi:hypothetical protein EWM64_g4936 [Hericium alpestre]|uniref:Cytochrome P450 n=1 Tax=Hericium alpestre TaxID=135208 RepID=A0A4Y9ZYB5_9AGAM|nr:hypothetical protein EWM64_g4936 [Hericium alpestre]